MFVKMNKFFGFTSWKISIVIFMLMVIVMGVLFQPTISYLIKLWNQFETGNYAHGYLVLAVSGYIVYEKLDALKRLLPQHSFAALFSVVLASFFWATVEFIDVEMLQTVGLLLLLLTVVWSIFGLQIWKELAFPILFICFAIPIWFPLSPILQDITAEVVYGIVQLFNLTASREDNLILLPYGTMSIDEACSGLNYLLAAMTMGTLYAYLNFIQLKMRIMIILIVITAAVLANILRVFLIVYVGYTSQMKHPWVHDHLTMGWVLFSVIMGALLFLDNRIQSRREVVKDDPSAGQVSINSGSHEVMAHLDKADSWKTFVFTIVLTVALVSGPYTFYLTQHKTVAENVEIVLPERQTEWRGVISNRGDWRPAFHGAVSQKRLYIKDKEKVSLYIGYYPVQKQGEELVNGMNRISNEENWRPIYYRDKSYEVDGFQVKEQVVTNAAQKKRLIWYWYSVAGQQTTNKYIAKALQLLAILNRSEKTYVVIFSTEFGELDRARGVMRDFMAGMKVEQSHFKVLEN